MNPQLDLLRSVLKDNPFSQGISVYPSTGEYPPPTPYLEHEQELSKNKSHFILKPA